MEGKQEMDKVHDDVWALDLQTWQVPPPSPLPFRLPASLSPLHIPSAAATHAPPASQFDFLFLVAKSSAVVESCKGDNRVQSPCIGILLPL